MILKGNAEKSKCSFPLLYEGISLSISETTQTNMSAPMAATSQILFNLDSVDNLTDLDEIQKAYDRLCKEEVVIHNIFAGKWHLI